MVWKRLIVNSCVSGEADANYQQLADIALGAWTENYGALDRIKLNRQLLLQLQH